MPLLISDRELLDAFRRGERQAIERVYHAHVGQVTGLLRKGFSFMSGGQQIQFRGYQDDWELECAVQDTFILAFGPAARKAYDGIKPFGPYLLTIARNKVISNLRSDQRELRRRREFSAEPPRESEPTPESVIMRRQMRELVEAFVGGLPGPYREFYQLRYGEELNLMETARRLGVTRMKARIREQKLRKRFLEFLRKRGYSLTGAEALVCLVLAGGGATGGVEWMMAGAELWI